jgi:hypothetical protein
MLAATTTTVATTLSSSSDAQALLDNKLPTTKDSIQDSMKYRNLTAVANDKGIHQASSETTKHATEESIPRHPSVLMSQTMFKNNHSSVIPQLSEHELKKYTNNIVSPTTNLAETCEAYQQHFQTFVTIGKSRYGSEFFQTSTILDHIVSSWIEKGGCFMHQGVILHVDAKLLQLILENHWNPCMRQKYQQQAETELQIKSTNNNHNVMLPQHHNTCKNQSANGTTTTNNEKVVTLGSNTLSDEFMYHIYPYARFHAKNIHSIMTRYRNSKRCLKSWYKHGGKMTDFNGLDLTHQEALCVMERILWQHHDEWLNEYIVI